MAKAPQHPAAGAKPRSGEAPMTANPDRPAEGWVHPISTLGNATFGDCLLMRTPYGEAPADEQAEGSRVEPTTTTDPDR